MSSPQKKSLKTKEKLTTSVGLKKVRKPVEYRVRFGQVSAAEASSGWNTPKANRDNSTLSSRRLAYGRPASIYRVPVFG